MDFWLILFALIFIIDFPAAVKCARRIDARERAKETMRKRSLGMKRAIEEENLSAKTLLGLSNYETMGVARSAKTSQGLRVERLQEKYKGIEVFDASVVVEVDRNGELTGDASGTLIEGIDEDLPAVEPKYSEEEAFDIALKAEGDMDIKASIQPPTPTLQVYLDKNEKARLVYNLQYVVSNENDLKRPAFIIDAMSGEVLLHWNNMDTVSCNNEIRGFGGNKAIGKIEYGDVPYCLDMTVEGDMCYLENRYVRVVDMMNSRNDTINETVSFVCSEGYNDTINGAYSPALDALFYGTIMGKMFEDWFQSSPLRQKVVLRVHYDDLNTRDGMNAFWNGENCTFGDGGWYMYPLVGFDVVCHEVGHGVTEQASNLYYFGQSGGLNEAFSDMLGEACENYFSSNDFLVGQGFIKDETRNYLRSFENPPVDGHSIRHVDDFYDEMDSHSSSGVFNRAFFVAIKQKGLELRQAVRAFYHANSVYWHHLSSFEDAACGVLKSVYDLGQKPSSYLRAFQDVGIDTCDLTKHIRALANNRSYDGIEVSTESQPLFAFESPVWAESVSIHAVSANGDVGIDYTVGSWNTTLFESEDTNEVPSHLNAVTIADVANTVIFFTLSSPDNQLLDDVTVTAGYTCDDEFETYDYAEQFFYRCYCYNECS